MNHNIALPLSDKQFNKLKLGDIIYLNGLIITARDQAHKRILEVNQKRSELPVSFNELKGCAIYHCGPILRECDNTYEIISGGPTTSQRMDDLENDIVKLLDVKFIIGKGGMKNLNTENVAYLSYPGGCGAIINKKIKKVINVFWKDLGLCEAVWFLEVEQFGPLILTQIFGKSLYIQ